MAARGGRTLTAVIEDALRQALSLRKVPPRGPAELPTFAGGGVQPGVDLDDSASLIALMEEDTDPS